jgi:hypothetical protein
MRNYLLFLILCLLATFQTFGQTRPDKIYQLDKTALDAYVDEIGETAITYFLPSDTRRQNPQKIIKARVWKIVFANGEEEVINPLPAEPATPALVVRPDRIFTTSNTIVEAKVLRIGQATVEYRRLDGGADSPVFELSLQKVIRIELADGSVRSFAPSGTDTRSAGNSDGTPAGRQETTRKPSRLRESRPIQTGSARERAEDARFGFSAAFVGSYVYKEPYWQADSNGIGLRQGLGGALTIQYKALNWLAIFLEGGYNQFLSNRTYLTPESDTLYTAKYILRTMPVQFGVKIYLPGQVYLGLSGGMNYLITRFDSYSDYRLETRRFSPVATAALGIEPRLGSLKLNIAVQYTYSTVIATSQYAASPAIHTPQFKLGIGL